jgi:hypothetical protein
MKLPQFRPPISRSYTLRRLARLNFWPASRHFYGWLAEKFSWLASRGYTTFVQAPGTLNVGLTSLLLVFRSHIIQRITILIVRQLCNAKNDTFVIVS